LKVLSFSLLLKRSFLNERKVFEQEFITKNGLQLGRMMDKESGSGRNGTVLAYEAPVAVSSPFEEKVVPRVTSGIQDYHFNVTLSR
jgi:hypothetical protein